jgi:hypothetical protein
METKFYAFETLEIDRGDYSIWNPDSFTLQQRATCIYVRVYMNEPQSQVCPLPEILPQMSSPHLDILLTELYWLFEV